MTKVTTFLNRLLALAIAMQGNLFTAFKELLAQCIEGAIAAGVYDLGLETLRAKSFRVTDRKVIYTHPGFGAETQFMTIAQKQRNAALSLADACISCPSQHPMPVPGGVLHLKLEPRL
jgi:hypothetical protein